MQYKLRMRLSVSPALAEGMAKTSPLASNLKERQGGEGSLSWRLAPQLNASVVCGQQQQTG